MSDSEQIKSAIKEAELYRKQGLLKQARAKYSELQDFVASRELFSRDQKFMEALKSKIQRVEDELREVEEAPDVHEVPQGVQDLIGRLFSFSQNKDMAAVEGAVALAKFGQIDRAVAEFQRLIKEGILPRLAATNLLSCHLTHGSPESAVSQFQQWVSLQALPWEDMEYLRGYLQSALEKKGIAVALPALPKKSAPEKIEARDKEEEAIEISTLSFTVPAGPKKGQVVEWDVTFQSGNAVSIIIPVKDREVADAFKAGLRLGDLQCYSVMGIFKGAGTVRSKTVISSGPKKGDFTVDITIDSV